MLALSRHWPRSNALPILLPAGSDGPPQAPIANTPHRRHAPAIAGSRQPKPPFRHACTSIARQQVPHHRATGTMTTPTGPAQSTNRKVPRPPTSHRPVLASDAPHSPAETPCILRPNTHKIQDQTHAHLPPMAPATLLHLAQNTQTRCETPRHHACNRGPRRARAGGRVGATRAPYRRNTAPGFRMPRGSRNPLIPCIICTPTGSP